MAEYIERAAAVTVCNKQYRECLRKNDFCGDTVAWNICADIKAIPAADVAPVVRGRWIKGPSNPYCSECFVECRDETPFCPNCGAKMDGGDGDAVNRR